MIEILNQEYKPSLDEITDYIEQSTRKRWKEALIFIDQKFHAKETISFSKCCAKPGWNVKYKKSGKALCTLYPGQQSFTALIVLNGTDMEWFKGMRDDYSTYILELYDNCNLFNGTKWLMIDITSDEILNDVKNLMLLKLQYL